MTELALQFGWVAQSIVLISTIILVMYIIASEDWDKESIPNKKEKPTAIIRQYISDFNSKKDLERNFDFPIMVLSNGEKNIHNDLSKIFDYEDLIESGWKYTSINSLDIVSELNNTAIVRLNFYRHNKFDQKYLRANVLYTLTKKDSNWLISSIDADEEVNLGMKSR